ncbi:MAG: pectate lyase [Prevotella sp.]|nr:pectate lyase [Prevotella sp.]
MKKLLLSLTLTAIATTLMAQAPAFPGAEGHGRYTTGGRGGEVRHVTTLNDDGKTSTKGTFRWAVNGSNKKIVVFDVGGVIALTKDLTIGDNTTILGQTAPAPGITLRYYTIQPGNNCVVRFIRSRRGEEKDVNDGADAIWQRNKTGILLDHCSFSWSIDEVASFYDNNNFTMQWCTIAESLVHPGHSKGAHGYGGIWGGKLASFHHNLIAHVANRSPRFNGARYEWKGYTGNKQYLQYAWENEVQAENVDFRNCVIYNCGNGCYGGPGGGQINIVNNYYKTGPAAGTSRVTQITVGANGNASGHPNLWDMTSRYYIDGNQMNNTENFNGWSNIAYDSGTYTIDGEQWSPDPKHYYGTNVTYKKNSSGVDCIRIRLDEPAPTGEVTTHTAKNAYEKVLTYAGASLNRDNVDERYEKETRAGNATYKGSATSYEENGTTKSCTPTWGRIDHVSDVNGYTEANFGTGSRAAGFDTDNDGIPDAWETANGLNPNDAKDALTYTLDPVKYYTNLEVYANSLVQDIMLAGNADAIDAVAEYYPAYTNEAGTKVAAINQPEIQEASDVTYTLAQSTNMGSNNSSTYYFDNDITITNTKSKGYATGNNDGIKYSAGVQYTINLPADISINKTVFAGYDNYTDANAYLGEVNGTSYEATQYVFPNTKESVVNTVEFDSPATGQITFTPQGKQVVLSITLIGKKGDTSGITLQRSLSTPDAYYNLQGLPVATPTKRGVYIKNGKKIIVQ